MYIVFSLPYSLEMRNTHPALTPLHPSPRRLNPESTGLHLPPGQAPTPSPSALLFHLEQHSENAVHCTLRCDHSSALTLSCFLHTMDMGTSGPRITEQAK